MKPSGGQLTAVFASELRSDLGFGSPLLSIADELVALAARGGVTLRTVFLLNDPVYAGDEVAAHGHAVLPAPAVDSLIEISSSGRSYANILASIGFAHERELMLQVAAWDRLLAWLSPSVLVVDNAPSACLAARGRIPLFVTGSGFSAPPPRLAVFPAVASHDPSETNQTIMQAAVSAVLHRRGTPPVGALPELLAGDRRAVFALPHLDPYRQYRDERLLHPCLDIQGPLESRDAPVIFLAVPSTFPGLTDVVRAIDRAGPAVVGYVPGPETVGVALLKHIGASMFATRPPLRQALADASLVLAASADVATAAYLAGLPQVILQGDIETTTIASELQDRKTAISLKLGPAEELTRALRDVLNNPAYAQSAREEARRAQAARPAENPAQVAAAMCLDLLRSSDRCAAERSETP
jgi:hypothetical protein